MLVKNKIYKIMAQMKSKLKKKFLRYKVRPLIMEIKIYSFKSLRKYKRNNWKLMQMLMMKMIITFQIKMIIK